MRRMAAQLLLALPNQTSLRSLAGALADLPIDALAAGLAEESRALHAALVTTDSLPLAAAARAFQLSAFEIDLLSLAMLPEVDDRFGDAFSVLRGGPRRPSLGLALRLLVGSDTDRLRSWSLLHQRDLWRYGLLIPGDVSLPLADRELLPSATLCAGVLGVVPGSLSRGAVVRLETTTDPEADRLRPSQAALADELRVWVRATGTGVVLLTGDPVPGRELAAAVAARVGLPLLCVGPVPDGGVLKEAGALAWMLNAALVAELPSDLASFSLPDPWTVPPCTLLLCALTTRVDAPVGLPIRKLAPPVPGPAEQSAAWGTLARAAGSAFNADLLGNQTRLPLSAMRAAVLLARARGALHGAGVMEALEQIRPDPASPSATVTRPRVPWDALVLPPRTAEVLVGLRERLSHRATVQDRWGLRGPEGRGDGIVALLHGEPGTGKTLVAEAMATALGLPLMRVDLSRVVSKYIGETEKNLANAFDSAEGFRAVLFFDEADSLFSRRTAVSDAHDRYANLETSYLLQRLEAFEGLALLATNALQNVDEAFLRRIPFVIPLARPSRAMQRRLWARCIPTEIRDPDLDLDHLAQRYDLVGGEIRSAAVGAAYAAASAGVAISGEILERSIRQELHKRGRPVPE